MLEVVLRQSVGYNGLAPPTPSAHLRDPAGGGGPLADGRHEPDAPEALHFVTVLPGARGRRAQVVGRQGHGVKARLLEASALHHALVNVQEGLLQHRFGPALVDCSAVRRGRSRGALVLQHTCAELPDLGLERVRAPAELDPLACRVHEREIARDGGHDQRTTQKREPLWRRGHHVRVDRAEHGEGHGGNPDGQQDEVRYLRKVFVLRAPRIEDVHGGPGRAQHH
mmetsp:Transcript_23446/g.67607  ORF Transcript_23446/g.67607 Transcript_23446/m.67607 type:complete len:225 (-) Transcript_23446:1149-1823(-)